MPFEFIPSLLLFAFVSSVTPGPNNIMLLASGAHFGMRASAPHMAGILIGHAVMTVLVALGLGASLLAYPAAGYGLKLVSALYMIWLAGRILRSGPPELEPEAVSRAKPLNFWQAAAFQWINPKAWVMTLAAVGAFLPNPGLWGGFVLAGCFMISGLPGLFLWTGMGQGLNRFLQNPKALGFFNAFAALLLIASIYPVVMMNLQIETAAP